MEKIVLSLANTADARLVLEGMIENGFFSKPKSAADTMKHLYIDREEKKEEQIVVDQVLAELAKGGKLTVENGSYSMDG